MPALNKNPTIDLASHTSWLLEGGEDLFPEPIPDYVSELLGEITDNHLAIITDEGKVFEQHVTSGCSRRYRRRTELLHANHVLRHQTITKRLVRGHIVTASAFRVEQRREFLCELVLQPPLLCPRLNTGATPS